MLTLVMLLVIRYIKLTWLRGLLVKALDCHPVAGVQPPVKAGRGTVFSVLPSTVQHLCRLSSVPVLSSRALSSHLNGCAR